MLSYNHSKTAKLCKMWNCNIQEVTKLVTVEKAHFRCKSCDHTSTYHEVRLTQLLEWKRPKNAATKFLLAHAEV